MFQQFFKDTLVSRFIKRLLRSTNLPSLHLIHEGDMLIAGARYIYKNLVLLCVTSGKFTVDTNDYLFPSDSIYPSRVLLPNYYNKNAIEAGNEANMYNLMSSTYIEATYKVIKYYEEDDPQIHYNFHSKFMYYDPETHYYLGEYLRYLRDRNHIDLMPYYNCFNNQEIPDLDITYSEEFPTFSMIQNKQEKVLAIPVKFGKTYTIAFDSDTPIKMRTVIYNKASGMVIKDSLSTDIDYYTNDISDYEYIPNSIYTKPFLKYIPPVSDLALFNQERNLYLILQVSKNNTSALTVLEGDFTNSWYKLHSNYESKYNYTGEPTARLSLLHFNAHTSFAFSDRLIEYLLRNVIDKTESLDGNIKYFQELLETIYPNFMDNKIYGLWYDDMKLKLYEYLEENASDIRDIDGNLSIEAERFLLSLRGYR